MMAKENILLDSRRFSGQTILRGSKVAVKLRCTRRSRWRLQLQTMHVQGAIKCGVDVVRGSC
jgi:hypothetical protein